MNGWRVRGPYFESCDCDAICVCRRVDGVPGTAVDVCRFALAWSVQEGHFDDLDLSGLGAVLAGYWDDRAGTQPWHVGLYVDERGGAAQRDALAGILTGRFGGTPRRQYAGAIRDLLFVQPAEIAIDHTPGRQSIRVRGHVSAQARERFPTPAQVTCGIPGHDQGGYEVVMESLRVAEDGLDFDFHGNCGFAAKFDYRAD